MLFHFEFALFEFLVGSVHMNHEGVPALKFGSESDLLSKPLIQFAYLAIMPSTILICRLARCPNDGSWVMIISVTPC